MHTIATVHGFVRVRHNSNGRSTAVKCSMLGIAQAILADSHYIALNIQLHNPILIHSQVANAVARNVCLCACSIDERAR